MKYSKKIDTYLDVGCGACRITSQLAKLLKVRACGSDLNQPFENSWDKRPDDINFKFIDDVNLIGHTGKWDLVTAVMVLHHIPEVEKTVAAISQQLNDDGLLIIKEHDCFNEYEDMMVDIEHSLFIVKNNDDWEKKIMQQYIKCRNWLEWSYMMYRHGLELCYQGPWGYINQTYGNTRRFIAVYKKLKK